MKKISVVLMSLMFFSAALYANSDAKRAQIQKSLDAQCEQARQEKLRPMRQKLIKECSKTKAMAECQQTYEHYGERSGARVPMFYDLPACEKATEHMRSYRKGYK